ncbi:MAG: sporulation protein YqfD [Oscillospiraceae bacterium]
MTFGNVKLQVIGDNYSRFYKEMLLRHLPCNDIREIKGVLTFNISVEYLKEIKALLQELNFEYRILKKRGIFLKVLRLLRHKGIILGALAVLIACIVLSNFVFRFNILCDSEETKEAILAVLNENGVEPGSYIPSLNLVYLERELKQKVEDISWAGISVSGSTLTIDIVKNIPEPESRKIRLPCNLIATCDAVIDKIELYDGQLMTTVGSAVTKGDVIVSGTVVNENISYEDGKEIKDIDTKYVRSLANIYGTFEKTVVINQPYSDTKKTVSDNVIKKRYLKIFDLQIPLFLSIPEGNYESSSQYNGIVIFGKDIPVGINTVSFSEYSFTENKYTEKETEQMAAEKLKKYEKNYFGDYEIKDVKTNERKTEEGIVLTAVYTLYGEIAKEAEFFIEK